MLAIALILESEPDVHLSLNCEAGVWGTHSGKRLVNRLYGILNYAGSYLTYSGGEGFYPALPCEGVEDRDRIPVR